MPGPAPRPPLILVVDDDEYVHALVAAALRRLPAEVIAARSGGEALAALARRLPDLIVLDLALPDTDGLALLERIRQRGATAEVPVVILSGLVGHPAARSTRVAGFVEKPFRATTLLDVVRSALDRPAGRAVAERRPLPA
jgi:CheY-like chemotaxis protein